MKDRNILLNDKDVIEFYSNHNVKTTLKKFNITYSELKEVCKRNDFAKTSEQIKETYRTTRIEKYGSIEMYRLAKRQALERNSFNRWINNLNNNERSDK